jgi:hypothetical protein
MTPDHLHVPHDWKRVGWMLAAFATLAGSAFVAFYQLIRAS